MSGVSGETCARTPDANARSSVTVSRRRTKEVTQIMKALLNRDSVWPAGIQTFAGPADSPTGNNLSKSSFVLNRTNRLFVPSTAAGQMNRFVRLLITAISRKRSLARLANLVGTALVPGESVPDDHAALHHKAHPLHFSHVRERISRNSDDVGEFAFLDAADVLLDAVIQHVGGIHIRGLQGLHRFQSPLRV